MLHSVIRTATMLVILALAVAVGCELAHGQNANASCSKETDQQVTSGLSGSLTFPDSCGTKSNTFEMKVAGGPATNSVTISGCMRGGTCTSLVTSTSTANTNLSIAGGPFDNFKIAWTLTGGASPTLTFNRTGTVLAQGLMGGAGSWPSATTVDGVPIPYYGADICDSIFNAIAAWGSGHRYDASGFPGVQFCPQNHTWGNTTVMLYGGQTPGVQMNNTITINGQMDLYIDGVAGNYSDGGSNFGTPAIILPWGTTIIDPTTLGGFIHPCKGAASPIAACTTSVPVRSFPIIATSLAGNLLTITTSGTFTSLGGPGGNQNIYPNELAALVSPSCPTNNLLRMINTVPTATTATIFVPTSTVTCASAATLYLVTPMIGYGYQGAGINYEPIRVGTSQAFGGWLTNVSIDMESVPGLVAVQNLNQGELAGYNGIYIRHPALCGVQVMNTAAESGPYTNTYVQTLVSTTNVNPTTCGIYNQGAVRGFNGFTETINPSLHGGALEPNACVYNNGSAVEFSGEFHCEGPLDQFQVATDNSVAGMVVNTVVSGPPTNSNTNQIHLVKDSFLVTGSKFAGVVQQPGGSTNAIQDDINGVTCPETASPEYATMNNGKPVYNCQPSVVTGTAGINIAALAQTWYQNPAGGALGGFTFGVANTLYFGIVNVPNPTTFSNLYYNVNTLDAGNNSDIGIFTCPGNDCTVAGVTAALTCDIGARALAASGQQKLACAQTTPITIQPGNYIVGVCSNGTTLKFADSTLAQAVPFATPSVAAACANGQLANFTTPAGGNNTDLVNGVYLALH